MFIHSLVSSLLVSASSVFALPTDTTLQLRDTSIPPRVVTYIQTFHDTSGNALSLQPLLDTGVTHINLAALHINSDPSGITLNDNYPNSSVFTQVWKDVKVLQNGGIKALVMVGGAAAGSYPRLCGTAVPAVIDESYYGPLHDIVTQYDLDGMDLDIEETVDVSCPIALVRRLKADFGDDFLVTMAPVASCLMPNMPCLGDFSYFDLDSEAGSDVDWYNAQFYNGWGDASSQVDYDAIDTDNWSPDRVLMGVLDNSADGGSGFVGIDQLESVINQLQAKFANYGGVVGWEYWDAGGGDNLTQPQWVEAIANAMFTTPPAQETANYTSSPLPTAPSPWPALTNIIIALGATLGKTIRVIDTVYALNRTNGDLAAAESLLGLL